MRSLAALVSAFLLLAPAAVPQAESNSRVGLSTRVDLDQDGLSDDLEQALLARFAPAFRTSPDDCDVLPAQFLSGSRTPIAVDRNATAYGRVFKNRSEDRTGILLEIHYYHLWSRDCGRIAHALDVEHVSALVRAASLSEPVTNWRAVYWYAAAHENTICDISHGARASVLGAVDRGPDVWISSGKHASFLDQSLCGRGCGADRCDRATLLEVNKLINIGERRTPMNGAVWIRSDVWPLSSKMETDFSKEVIARLEEAPIDVVSLNGSPRPAQAVLSAGSSAFSALEASDRNTGAALSSATRSMDQALSASIGRIGIALQRSHRAVARALRFGIK